MVYQFEEKTRETHYPDGNELHHHITRDQHKRTRCGERPTEAYGNSFNYWKKNQNVVDEQEYEGEKYSCLAPLMVKEAHKVQDHEKVISTCDLNVIPSPSYSSSSDDEDDEKYRTSNKKVHHQIPIGIREVNENQIKAVWSSDGLGCDEEREPESSIEIQSPSTIMIIMKDDEDGSKGMNYFPCDLDEQFENHPDDTKVITIQNRNIYEKQKDYMESGCHGGDRKKHDELSHISRPDSVLEMVITRTSKSGIPVYHMNNMEISTLFDSRFRDHQEKCGIENSITQQSSLRSIESKVHEDTQPQLNEMKNLIKKYLQERRAKQPHSREANHIAWEIDGTQKSVRQDSADIVCPSKGQTPIGEQDTRIIMGMCIYEYLKKKFPVSAKQRFRSPFFLISFMNIHLPSFLNVFKEKGYTKNPNFSIMGLFTGNAGLPNIIPHHIPTPGEKYDEMMDESFIKMMQNMEDPNVESNDQPHTQEELLKCLSLLPEVKECDNDLHVTPQSEVAYEIIQLIFSVCCKDIIGHDKCPNMEKYLRSQGINCHTSGHHHSQSSLNWDEHKKLTHKMMKFHTRNPNLFHGTHRINNEKRESVSPCGMSVSQVTLPNGRPIEVFSSVGVTGNYGDGTVEKREEIHKKNYQNCMSRVFVPSLKFDTTIQFLRNDTGEEQFCDDVSDFLEKTIIGPLSNSFRYELVSDKKDDDYTFDVGINNCRDLHFRPYPETTTHFAKNCTCISSVDPETEKRLEEYAFFEKTSRFLDKMFLGGITLKDPFDIEPPVECVKNPCDPCDKGKLHQEPWICTVQLKIKKEQFDEEIQCNKPDCFELVYLAERNHWKIGTGCYAGLKSCLSKQSFHIGRERFGKCPEDVRWAAYVIGECGKFIKVPFLAECITFKPICPGDCDPKAPEYKHNCVDGDDGGVMICGEYYFTHNINANINWTHEQYFTKHNQGGGHGFADERLIKKETGAKSRSVLFPNLARPWWWYIPKYRYWRRYWLSNRGYFNPRGPVWRPRRYYGLPPPPPSWGYYRRPTPAIFPRRWRRRRRRS